MTRVVAGVVDRTVKIRALLHGPWLALDLLDCSYRDSRRHSPSRLISLTPSLSNPGGILRNSPIIARVPVQSQENFARGRWLSWELALLDFGITVPTHLYQSQGGGGTAHSEAVDTISSFQKRLNIGFSGLFRTAKSTMSPPCWMWPSTAGNPEFAAG